MYIFPFKKVIHIFSRMFGTYGKEWRRKYRDNFIALCDYVTRSYFLNENAHNKKFS